MEAVVVLEIIDPPLRELAGIGELMLKAARIAGTGMDAAAGIDPQLQAQ